MIKFFDSKRAVALKKLGVLSSDELFNMAEVAVAQGCDNPLIIRLSMCESSEDEINYQLDEIEKQCGLTAMTVVDALRFYSKEVSGLILSGGLSPRDGANILWRAQINSKIEDFHELDGFIYAASEMDDRPEDKKLFEDGILREAGRVIGEY
ncbi:hypothetical protein [Paracidovorax valerianellae]|uniref:hypothetical protein n=1 Tax=Paracidovorax valerianellae TaxID=187868 RepID=UPI001113AF9E|nr:hypothetical protein [Paracidovorax valerianellae]MDA8445727.1 hypothetical protein [Paracidovorax valerianellae]